MEKILVVDDETKIRNIYKKLLSLEQYEVVEAGDCSSAAQALIKDKGIGLVLLDINMPVLDGSVLYRMIRLLDPLVKVIMTSARPLQEQQILIDHADDYYDKSQDTHILVEKVRHAFAV